MVNDRSWINYLLLLQKSKQIKTTMFCMTMKLTTLWTLKQCSIFNACVILNFKLLMKKDQCEFSTRIPDNHALLIFNLTCHAVTIYTKHHEVGL